MGAALTLDLYRGAVNVTDGQNLQFGTWLSGAGYLNDAVTGFYTVTTVKGVDVNLKILLTTDLHPYGFVSSTGAKVMLPVTAAVFAEQLPAQPSDHPTSRETPCPTMH